MLLCGVINRHAIFAVLVFAASFGACVYTRLESNNSRELGSLIDVSKCNKTHIPRARYSSEGLHSRFNGKVLVAGAVDVLETGGWMLTVR